MEIGRCKRRSLTCQWNGCFILSLVAPFQNTDICVDRERFRWIFEGDLSGRSKKFLVDIGMRLQLYAFVRIILQLDFDFTEFLVGYFQREQAE